ncbi:MAG: WecB/TagA/CpsF family glycosyltransferase [Clostridium sp.]|jgi:N-acetylglucosaminyldiphosphoundecaprenol N-acetyl-beta-D-mannosaminyltransferase|nr:WecB/TagA/CpsF family glycosyltransferase [Clostridium sp.]
MYTNILGYKVFNETKENFLREIDKRDKTIVISGNPEILYSGLENENLNKLFNGKDSIIIPDGVGTVIAAKMVKNPVKEKIAGIEVMKAIIEKCEKEGKGIYLLGAEEEILKLCKENIKKTFPNIKIVGSHNGFFDLNNCNDIIEDIKKSNPWGLFIAMGCPRQENFIVNYIDELNCNFYMPVGGSFDVFAGKVNRAPKWMLSLGLEWLYRVLKEPWRIKRLGVIPKFLLRVLKNN